jgi:co-chaperonin GroES (HSP10)
MSKKVISPSNPFTALSADTLVGQTVIKKKQPSIKAVRPLGAQVLVEVFLEEEVSPDSIIILPDNAKNKGDRGCGGAPQGRVLDIGPGLSKEFGIKVGDRVLLQGSFVPLPKLADGRDGDRERALVEPHTIKAVLEEVSAIEV